MRNDSLLNCDIILLYFSLESLFYATKEANEDARFHKRIIFVFEVKYLSYYLLGDCEVSKSSSESF